MLFYLESFLLISAIFGFLFFAIEHIRKPGNQRIFSCAHFLKYQDYLTNFEHFPGILCDQDSTLKVLHKVINENLPLKLERILFLLKPKWHLDKKKMIVFKQFSSNGKPLTLVAF